MALTGPDIVMVMEIVGITNISEYNYYAQILNSDQETLLTADVATWRLIRDKHLKVKGGPDGVDLDNDRKRQAIIRRCKIMLRMVPSGYSGGTMILRT